MRHPLRPFALATLALTLATAASVAVAGGDAEDGKDLFESECTLCHSVEPGKVKVGPSLAGVVGRKAGSMAGFAYSDVVKNSGITWTEDEIDSWITNPQQKLPGTHMTYAGEPHPDERASIIAYLKTLK